MSSPTLPSSTTAPPTGWLATQKPTKGEATWTGRATGYGATADADGSARPLAGRRSQPPRTTPSAARLMLTDDEGKPPTTAYTPADAGPLTKTIVTDPKGYRSAAS